MMTMGSEMHAGPLLAALLYAFVGLVIFAVAFIVVDRMTPYHLWKEIVDEKNTALAIIVGAVAIGISVIVASAIR